MDSPSGEAAQGTRAGGVRRRVPPVGRWWVAVPLAAALVPLLGGGCSDRGRLPGVNILLVTIDTMRADRLGCYGHAVARTPNLDRLAAAGVQFENAFASVPLTLPSHASFLTGLHPSRHGVHDNGSYRLPEERKTLAERLSDAGYRTAAFVASFQLDRKYGLAQGFEEYDDRMPAEFRIHDERIAAGPAAEELRRSASERRADEVTTLAEGWLARADQKPFFLWLHYFDPHEIYDPPPPFDRIGRARTAAAAAYDGEIAYLDRELGRLIAYLYDMHIYDRTVIILSADHGEGLGQHREIYHDSFIYDSTVRIPLLLSGGAVPVGWPRLVPGAVRSVDLLPTLLEAAGIPLEEEGSDGSSWFPLLDSGKGGPGWRTYLETYSPTHNRTSELFGVRTGRWKYIEAPIPELYDVEADPGETRNLIAARPDTARALRADLLARLPEKSAPPLDVDEATRAKLEAIGYVREEPGAANAAEGEPLPDPKELIPCVEGLHLADRHYTYGRYDSALAILGELEKACPGRGRILDHIARIEVRLGRYDRLVDRFGKIVREEGANAKARFWLGLGLMESGRPAEAIESFRAAVEIEPSLALAHYHMGNACEKLGRPEEAARAWEAARHADPNGRTGLLAERSLRRAMMRLREGRGAPFGGGTEETATSPGLND